MMPRYRPESQYGYDLDLELPFIDIEGKRFKLGSVGSIIMVCETCGEEHFRQSVSEHETCFKGHGKMVPCPLTGPIADAIKDIWRRDGVELTTVDERRAMRLDRERKRPWGWQFGHRTEVDFPDGFAEVDGKKVA